MSDLTPDISKIRQAFSDIELEGRTIKELLDFEDQPDFKILSRNTSKQIEYLQEKADISKALTSYHLNKDFTQFTLKGIYLGCPLYVGIDKDELKKWFTKIYYSFTDGEFYNTETKAKFPTRELAWLIRPILLSYHDSVVVDFYQPSDKDNGTKAKARYSKLLFQSITSYIIHYKAIEKISISEDLWINEQITSRKNNVLKIVEPLVLAKYDKEKSDNYIVNTEFWNSYANFDDEIDWICACRFASTRKRCYRWQRFPSSWGKSFKANIYYSLGILWEFDVNELVNIIKKQPAGVSALDLYNKWILFFDEFNFAHGTLKKLDNHLAINQKNSFVATVEVYAKLFNSAEDVKTLTGDGVETQFSERFLFENKQDVQKTLDGYEIYNKNKSQFETDVTIYAYERILNNLDMYKNLGREQGTKYANEFVDKTYKQYKWAGGNLEDIITEGIKNLKELITSYCLKYKITVDSLEAGNPRERRVIRLSDMPNEVQKIIEHIHYKDNEIYVQNSTKCEELISRHLGIGSSQKKIGYKTLSDFTDYPSKDIPTKRINMNGSQTYVRYWFDVKETHTQIISGSGDVMPKNDEPLSEWSEDIDKLLDGLHT